MYEHFIGNQLTYENFIYLCLGVTFPSEDSMTPIDAFDSQNQELVLDVPEGTRVVLNRKETGKRSQLWRMTGSGMLQHEGSSPPRDPANPNVSVFFPFTRLHQKLEDPRRIP